MCLPCTKQTNSNSAYTRIHSVALPNDTPWEATQWTLRRHFRSFASFHELNSDDTDTNNVTSYSTRVERVCKIGNIWRLNLRRLNYLPRTNQIEATWWTEVFLTWLEFLILLT